MKQITSSTPELLLYGNYNAGKSTFINLLTSSQQAQVGDIPTTAGINSYEWNNALLLIARASMPPSNTKRWLLIIFIKLIWWYFVIRSGDVDEIGLYQNIAEMLKQRNSYSSYSTVIVHKRHMWPTGKVVFVTTCSISLYSRACQKSKLLRFQ